MPPWQIYTVSMEHITPHAEHLCMYVYVCVCVCIYNIIGLLILL